MNACDIPGQALRVTPDAFPQPELDIPLEDDLGQAVLAGGCFWCTEAVFRRLDGVTGVWPGYAGGNPLRANYKAVCTGTTGHAEAISIGYDATRISYGQLLRIFMSVAHDPTQKDRQGDDVGSQYRSAIFWMDEHQRWVAEAYLARLKELEIFNSKIVTTLEPLEKFFVAEPEHHDYAGQHPWAPYIRAVARPKLDKLEIYFPEHIARPDEPAESSTGQGQ